MNIPFCSVEKENMFDVEVGTGKINMSRLWPESPCKPRLLFAVFSPLTAGKTTARKPGADVLSSLAPKKASRAGGGCSRGSPMCFGVPPAWGEPKAWLLPAHPSASALGLNF